MPLKSEFNSAILLMRDGKLPGGTVRERFEVGIVQSYKYAAIMSSTKIRPLLPDTIREALREICAGRNIERVELFGSRARGDDRPDSDVDLLVDFSASSNPGLLELGELKEALEERLGCRVDVLTRRAVERSRNPIRRRAILADRVPVYARG